ncbi:site-specific integrase [Dyella sp. EPa41]|uniref:site-specific integrase n=1 Tax=Dyella sp. EPa41 TaxID=1561194 RepID=UPI001914E064|nr:site-specific integrase [Dyella sp. EPa41]
MFKRLSMEGLPNRLRGPLLVDDQGIPRYWATVWGILTLNDAAPSTQEKRLRHVDDLYRHADRVFGHGSLDASLGSLSQDRFSEILETWFISIANQPITSGSDELRWQTGFGFVSFIVAWQVKSASNIKALSDVHAATRRLSHLYKQLRIQKPRQATAVRSLPGGVVEGLYQVLDPASPNNPFKRERTKWLVYLSFLLMLHQGLRRGEILLLPVDAVKTDFDARRQEQRFWLNVRSNPYEDEHDDPRYTKPSIKTEQSIRQIPVSSTMAGLVQTYAENYRGRTSHSFLLNSQKNLPLSTESLTKIFAKASSSLATPLKKELNDRIGRATITPHDLRHTCAVIRLTQLLAQGDSMDEATQKLRAFFGWSRTSSMPMRYARAVFEDRLEGVWSSQFDSQVSVLRAIS